MTDVLYRLLKLINENDGINNKAHLTSIVTNTLPLVEDRSVYYCNDYAIRFSSSASRNFGNTVLSLSRLRKYDDRPFIVCLVTPSQNYCLIANSTFLKKISHSSQKLTINNIRGSFNGSDIVQEFEGICNSAENIERLFAIHAEIGFEGNLARLVEATNNISPSGTKYHVEKGAKATILEAPQRAMRLVNSKDCVVLKNELDAQVVKYNTAILKASLIDSNINRGRIIEYLIAGEDETIRQELVSALKNGDSSRPNFKTRNKLGDYHRCFDVFDTEIDIKTKIMSRKSNPKGYNLDKMLKFLTGNRSVFMFYFVGLTPGKKVHTALISMFQKDLLCSTKPDRRWSGGNSRGAAKLSGKTIGELITTPDSMIDEREAIKFLKDIIDI